MTGLDGSPDRAVAPEGRWERMALRWRRRLDWYQAPEVLLSALVVLAWSLYLGSQLGVLGAILVMVPSVWIHFAAVETGNLPLLWLSTVTVLGLAGISTAVALQSVDGLPLSLTAASLTALGYSELVRLNHARRRAAVIDPEIFVGSAVSIGLVGLLSLAGVWLAVSLDGGGVERSWLWMPVAALTLAGVALSLTLFPGRRAPAPSRQRWRPGERIPPPPLGRDSELPH